MAHSQERGASVSELGGANLAWHAATQQPVNGSV